MTSGWRRFFGALLFLTLAGWVYEPLMRSGPLGPDYEVLVGASRMAFPQLGSVTGVDWERLLRMPGAEGQPLAGLSLALSSLMWTDGGVWDEAALQAVRWENLILLIACALFLGRFVLRLLLPWTGSDQARAAGLAATLFLVVHPLAASAVASPNARPLLLGSACASGAAWCFLSGRQDRRYSLVFLAALLTLVCALSSDLAYLVPPALALTEYVSAHRYRPGGIRLRTSLTTLAILSGCAALPVVAWAVFGAESQPVGLARSLASFGSVDSALRSVLVALERLGFSILPVNAAGRGVTGFIIGVGLMLLAIQPALQAARAAPRLWAGAIGSWALLITVAVVYRLDLRVHPLDLSDAASMFPAAAVMAAAMGLSATALTGRRRVVIPSLALLGAGLLARADARCIEEAARESSRVYADLVLAQTALGEDHRILLLDPPGLVAGHPAIPRRLEWMLDRALTGGDLLAEEQWARGAESAAFRTLAVAGELDLVRLDGLIVLVLQYRIRDLPPWPRLPRVHFWVPPPRATQGPRSWREEGRSPALDLDPLEVCALHVDPRPGAPVGGRVQVSWKGDAEQLPESECEGLWIQGEAGPAAWFDLSGSVAWLLSGRVRRLWCAGDLASLARARMLEALPPVLGVGEPEARGGDWVFAPDESPLVRPREGEPEHVLCLVDPISFDYLEIEGVEAGSALVFSGAQRFARSRWRQGGSLVWALEQRVDDQAVARSLGR